jgi:hypothetical protein
MFQVTTNQNPTNPGENTMTTNPQIVATGTNGYDLHAQVDPTTGTVTVRVRSARTGKPHANVQFDAATADGFIWDLTQALADAAGSDQHSDSAGMCECPATCPQHPALVPDPIPYLVKGGATLLGPSGGGIASPQRRKHRAKDGRSHRPTR